MCMDGEIPLESLVVNVRARIILILNNILGWACWSTIIYLAFYYQFFTLHGHQFSCMNKPLFISLCLNAAELILAFIAIFSRKVYKTPFLMSLSSIFTMLATKLSLAFSVENDELFFAGVGIATVQLLHWVAFSTDEGAKKMISGTRQLSGFVGTGIFVIIHLVLQVLLLVKVIPGGGHYYDQFIFVAAYLMFAALLTVPYLSKASFRWIVALLWCIISMLWMIPAMYDLMGSDKIEMGYFLFCIAMLCLDTVVGGIYIQQPPSLPYKDDGRIGMPSYHNDMETVYQHFQPPPSPQIAPRYHVAGNFAPQQSFAPSQPHYH